MLVEHQLNFNSLEKCLMFQITGMTTCYECANSLLASCLSGVCVCVVVSGICSLDLGTQMRSLIADTFIITIHRTISLVNTVHSTQYNT